MLGVSLAGTAFRVLFINRSKEQKVRKMEIEKQSFGVTSKGEQVTLYTLSNPNGMSVGLIDYGAIVQSICVPAGEGKVLDVVLGYEKVADYEVNPPHFGATIGRNGNRIEGGSFNLDGVNYELSLNENGRNNLHSGPDGYEFRMWNAAVSEEDNSVCFSILSPDGDQGFPGNFNVSVTYRLTDDNTLEIVYDGISDETTVANMTNHSYFNLNGHHSGSIMKHFLQIDADGYVPVDEYSIPYGTVEPVDGTVFDFREGKEIGTDADSENEQLAHTGGYDHNYALNGEGMRKIAFACGDISGVTMEVESDLPGVQFYAGNFISGEGGKDGIPYGVHEGFCLETQYFPNAVNVLAFESPKIEAGEKYHTVTRYHFGIR